MSLKRDPKLTKMILSSVSATLSAVNEVIAISSQSVSTKPLSEILKHELIKTITSPNIEYSSLLAKNTDFCESPPLKIRCIEALDKEIPTESLVLEEFPVVKVEKSQNISNDESEIQIDENLLALQYYGLNYDLTTNMDFGEHFQITPTTFKAILHKIVPHLTTSQSRKKSFRILVDYPTKLKISLLGIATDLSFNEIGSRFDMSRSSAHHVFQEFCYAMTNLAPEIIKWPNTQKIKEISDFFEKEFKIPGVIGILDSYFIDIHLRQKNSNIFALLQVVVSHEGTFLDVFTTCHANQGSETEMFEQSPLYDNLNTLVPDGNFLIASRNYSLMNKLLTPYQQNGALIYANDKYIKSLELARKKAKDTLDDLFFKFKRLKNCNMRRADKNAMLIVSACCLYNILKDLNT